MSVYTLTRIRVEPALAGRALRLAVRLGHRLERQRGFLSLQLFRAEEASRPPDTPGQGTRGAGGESASRTRAGERAHSAHGAAKWAEGGAFLALAEWDSPACEERVTGEPGVARLLAGIDAVCEVETQRRLEPLFHVHFPRRSSSIALARLARAHSDAAEAMKAADKEAGLKAMALPGSVGVFGGQSGDDPRLAFCRLEFDGEESLRRYRASTALAQWQEAGEATLEWATWWRREQRLEFWRVAAGTREAGEEEPQAALAGNLCLEIETSAAEGTATLRFHGRMDADATARFLKVRDALIRGGCHRLTLDLSDLGYIASSALQALLETARALKESGGHLTLIDNEGRFNRIVRLLQLERSLAVRRTLATPGDLPLS